MVGLDGAEAGPPPLERDRRLRRPIPAMTENSTPANCPADPERGNSLRAWLIDALALGMGALAVFHYQPLHNSIYYKSHNEKDVKVLPNAERYGDTLVRLPLYPTLSEKDQEFIIEKIPAATI